MCQVKSRGDCVQGQGRSHTPKPGKVKYTYGIYFQTRIPENRADTITVPWKHFEPGNKLQRIHGYATMALQDEGGPNSKN